MYILFWGLLNYEWQTNDWSSKFLIKKIITVKNEWNKSFEMLFSPIYQCLTSNGEGYEYNSPRLVLKMSKYIYQPILCYDIYIVLLIKILMVNIILFKIITLNCWLFKVLTVQGIEIILFSRFCSSIFWRLNVWRASV